MDSEGPHSAAH